MKRSPALLALEDGSCFQGVAIGASGEVVAEVVFNTAMSGYQEILTDPSYAKQMVTFTSPHIGNVGCNPDDMESKQSWASACIVREICDTPSNWRATESLPDFLKRQGVVGIAGIDTRRLTRLIREKGCLRGCLTTTHADNPEHAIALAQAAPPMDGQDLTAMVSNRKSEWTTPTWRSSAPSETPHHVVAYDFGVKHQILRLLVDRSCQLTVVPADTPADKVLALKPDGIFLSNGPGDPAACSEIIEQIKQLLPSQVPVFGICLGMQLLSLACGARTYKMPFGHHGANHPVIDLATQVVAITSQNHNFAVDESSLPNELSVTHRSLFDNSIQGIQHQQYRAFGFQGHPEASPGPHDLRAIFDKFIGLMTESVDA